MEDGLVISEEVLAAIAVTAARRVEGLSALVPRPGEALRLFKGEDLHYVKITGEEELTVEMTLRVRADTKGSVVAMEVQRAVKNALQTMTDKTVEHVNLKIQGADF